NRVSCQNNLKQIGLALMNYHMTYRHFPASRVTSPATHNWIPYVLPAVEQENLYKTYRLNVSWDHPNNQDAIRVPIKLYQCPSTPEDPLRLDPITQTRRGAISDYATPNEIALSLVASGLVASTQPPRNRGVMDNNSHTKLEQIKDGSSNTLVITEDAGRPA